MKLKVIGGNLKGKPLASPKGRAVRPTAARVREAVFNILQARIPDTIILDLFSGTGALGIEALSRGAARAIFIDNSQASLAVTKQNILACGLESAADMLRLDATRSLSSLHAFNMTFDIVFMDPPYEQGAVCRTLAALAETDCLKPGSTIVVEHSPKELIEDDGGFFAMSDRRKYGRTLVSFLKYMID